MAFFPVVLFWAVGGISLFDGNDFGFLDGYFKIYMAVTRHITGTIHQGR